MNSKTSYTLCTSSFNRNREKSSSSIFGPNLAKRLYSAQQKLRPVIDDVMRTTENSTEKCVNESHYLTLEQYADAISAAQILKEIDKILAEKHNRKHLKKNYKLNNFNLGSENVKMNKFGKIYVDTSILVQLIELHKTLGDIIATAKEINNEDTLLNEMGSYKQEKHLNSEEGCISGKGKNVSSEEIFNVIVTQSNSKPKIKINVLGCKNNDLTQKNTKTSLDEQIIQEKPTPKLYPLRGSIVVMSANTEKTGEHKDEGLDSAKKLSTLSEERTTNSEVNLTDYQSSSRKIKSTGSITTDDKNSKVTDVAGARKIILNCLCDLKKVRSFLERVDINVAADVQIQSAVFDNDDHANKIQLPPDTQKNGNHEQDIKTKNTRFHDDSSHLQVKPEKMQKKNTEQNDVQQKTPPHSDSNIKRGCRCDTAYASDTPMELLLDAGDENASKLIICIKGKTEEEGDVQIIIRQCSECKNVGEKGLITDQSTDGKSDVTQKSSKEKTEYTSDSTAYDEDVKSKEPDQRSGINIVFDPDTPSKSVTEPIQDSSEKEESVPENIDYKAASSEELEGDKPGINILFDPDHPSKTVVEPTTDTHKPSVVSGRNDDIAPYKDKSKEVLAPSDTVDHEGSKINVIFDPVEPSKSIIEPKKSNQNSDGLSRIKLYETTNLCFSTDDGQELVISLTIRPKTNGSVPKISLNDIFSESATDTEKPNAQQSQKRIDNIFGSDHDIIVEVQDKQDRVIPLSRTKICSSLQFDVSVKETKMKSNGIKHVNNGIVVRLKEMGVNNLLRACRPVKCGRPAVLNEKLKKGLPYSASLTSLPLEETDADIIDQSLRMSINKSKYCSVKNKSKTMAYLTHLGKVTDNINFTNNMHISFVYLQELSSKKQQILKEKYIEKKLGYYINLVHDVETHYKQHTYKINFFEIKKYNCNNTVVQKTTTNTLLGNNRDVLNYSGNLRDKFIPPTYIEMEDTYSPSPNQPMYDKNISLLSRNKNKNTSSNSSHQLKITTCKGNIEPKKESVQKSSCEEQRKFTSKIPVYKYNRKKSISCQEKLESESYIYNISSKSLPKDHADESIEAEKIISDGSEATRNTVKNTESLKFSEEQNKICNEHRHHNTVINHGVIENITTNDQKIDTSNITSNDSLEIYFNNFFRDKYFSKLALCQKQSSSLSLKFRRKKCEYYHSSRSHSQICLSDMELNLMHSKSNTKEQRRIHFSKIRANSEHSIGKNKEEIRVSLSAVFYFTKLFCEYWIRDILKNKDMEHKVIQVKTSSFDVSKKETIQKFFGNIQPRILEEESKALSTFMSQPNVEVGMLSEDSKIEFHITGSTNENDAISFSKETLTSFKYPKYFQYPAMDKQCSRNDYLITNNSTKINSCDNFQNLIVTFESNTSINACIPTCRYMEHQNGSFPTVKYTSSNKFLAGMSENVEHNILEEIIHANNWERADIEPFCYLVYQNYFKTPSMLQRVIQKSKNLFKLNCESMEYLNRTSSLPLKECKICGCSIKDCENMVMGNSCRCPNKKRPHSFMQQSDKIVSESEYSKSALKPLRSTKPTSKRGIGKHFGFCQNKKSVGLSCIPKKVDMGICTKLENKMKPKKRRKCYCIKCEKRMSDGSCLCSHCLGIFDKCVEVKPSNKEIAVQCACYRSKNTTNTKNVTNKKDSNESEILDRSEKQDNPDPVISQTEYGQVFYTGVKQEPIVNNYSEFDANIPSNRENKDPVIFQTEDKQIFHTGIKKEPIDNNPEYHDTIPSNSDSEDNKNDISLFEAEPPMIMNIKKERSSDESINNY